MHLSASHRFKYRHISLVEALIVAAAFAILVALLIPSLTDALEKGRQLQCINNLRQYGMIFDIYENDHYGWRPTYQFGPGANKWFDPLYATGLITIMNQEASPSLNCPSGDDAYFGSLGSNWSWWGRWIHAINIKSMEAPYTNGPSFRLSYTINRSVGTKKRIGNPDSFFTIYDHMSYGGSWMYSSLNVGTIFRAFGPNYDWNKYAYDIAAGYQRHSTKRVPFAGRMHFLVHDGHVETHFPHEAMFWDDDPINDNHYWKAEDP